MTEPVRLCLWSGPRNVSTALMYAFAQRADTWVFDEPLYAHYLARTNARNYHPGAQEVLASMDNDGERVVREVILGNRPVAGTTSAAPPKLRFYKHMTHHLVELGLSFLEQTVNVLLTRDPRQMLPSYAREVSAPTLQDVGYLRHVELLAHLRSLGQEPPVLDAAELLKDPRAVLTELCERIGIDFDSRMLRWSPGARSEDGVWAKYWYTSVHQSAGFQPFVEKYTPFPDHLEPLWRECQPYYEQLKQLAIGVR